MTSTAEHNTHDDTDRRPTRVDVTVNTHPVVLTQRKMTGLAIKQAAIAQGTAIEEGFQLSVKRGHRYVVVGDDDTIPVHDHQEFLAVAPDDNS